MPYRPGRALFWVLLLSLAVVLFAAGCQPPQVPQYEATPLPSAFRVAFVEGKSLNVMQVDGTDVTSLASDLQPTECAPYYVSPNGQWIAYQQADDGLWIAPVQGGSPNMLTSAMAGSVSWFPDSSGVVYTLEDSVFAQWLDSSQPRQPLASGGRRYLFPTWSPDGKYIAFLETTDTPNIFNVIIIQSDGTGWRTLGTTAPEPSEEQRLCPEVVAWSPDSTRFLVDFGDPAFAFYVAGGSPVQVGAGSAPTHHAWSPDGRSLTYQDEQQRLWLARADGSGHKQLTDFPVSESMWSPHNNQVVYISQRSGTSDLEVIDVETNQTRSLTNADNYLESSPSWTPDGKFLIFARHVLEGEATSEAQPVSAGIWHVPSDGSLPPQRLALTGDSPHVFAIR